MESEEDRGSYINYIKIFLQEEILRMDVEWSESQTRLFLYFRSFITLLSFKPTFATNRCKPIGRTRRKGYYNLRLRSHP